MNDIFRNKVTNFSYGIKGISDSVNSEQNTRYSNFDPLWRF